MKTLPLVIWLLASTLCTFGAPADSLIIQFGNKSRVAVYAPTKEQLKKIAGYDLNRIIHDMVSKLDSVPEGQVYVIHEENGKEYRRDSVAVVRKSRSSITINIGKGRSGDDSIADSTAYNKERTRRITNSGRNNWKVNTDFHFGLNTWLGGPGTTSFGGNSYELDPLGSRYFAISLTQNPAIVRTSRFKLGIRYGIQIAWNNFMFQESVVAQKGAEGVEFRPYPTHLAKSKLTVCNLEVPLMPQFSFYNSSRRRAFNIGLGGFVGYRIDSYTKIKLDNGDKFHDHGGFYLNNIQYGVQGTVGLANFNFFVKYNLNNSFQNGRGPAVHPLSFGITI